ncbi:uncharacterized protein LOC119179621 [Rhipicephalus microplus]|uniref:uncharacterized protein LOC119179621 n=1 Tax=Rhipicephalus microplus TaxID=6941 RepID=UPI003F6D3609
MMVKSQCMVILIFYIFKLSQSTPLGYYWNAPIPSAINIIGEPNVAHGCPTVYPQEAGIRDCSYYCKYVPENKTWLYGFFTDGIYCWADDYQQIIGLCYQGHCHPLGHPNITHLTPPTDDTVG